MQQVHGVGTVNELFFKEATIKKKDIIANYTANGGALDKNGPNDESSGLYEQFFPGAKLSNTHPHDRHLGQRNGSLTHNPSSNFYGQENVSYLSKDQQQFQNHNDPESQHKDLHNYLKVRK